MTNWKILNARITLFPQVAQSAPLRPDDLYQKIWDGRPDSFQQQINPLAPSIAQGKRGGLGIQCLVHPSRIDLNFVSGTTAFADSSVPLIEDTETLRTELERVVKSIDKGIISAASRTAIAIQFLSLHASVSAANRALMNVIPERYGLKISDEEDFVFQINRPFKRKKLPDLTINLITKWSVERLQIVTFGLPGGPPGAPAVMPSSSPKTGIVNAASILFDNNNSPGSKPLDPHQQASVLSDLFKSLVDQQKETGLDTEEFRAFEFTY